MKRLLIPAILFAIATTAHSQDEADKKAKLEPWQEDFLNLPEDRRNEVSTHVAKARELFQQKRIFETIEELRAAESIFGDSPDVENLLGACQVEFRAFEKAMEHFERANTLSPNNPSVLFNLAEVHFVSKNWADAQRYFKRVLALSEESESQTQLARLTEFKLMLCLIKSGDLEEARRLAGKYDELVDDSPFPYYAKAAIAYHDEKSLEAETALARANRVFRSEQILSPWKDTLMEFGYIKSFFGGDIAEDE